MLLKISVFFSFYTTIPKKGSWVSLNGLSGKALYASHSNHYKNWKENFACMRGRRDSHEILGADEAPHFPLSWMNDPVEIMIYDKKYFTLEEAGIIRLLGKFEVMDTRVVIKL